MGIATKTETRSVNDRNERGFALPGEGKGG